MSDVFGPVNPSKSVRSQAPTTQVNDFHKNDDVDFDSNSHHHTLGDKAGQAAAGNHTHSNFIGSQPSTSGNVIGAGATVDINGASINFTVKSRAEVFIVLVTFDVEVAGGAGIFVGRTVLDGVALSSEALLSFQNGRTTVSQHNVFTNLAPGAHSVKLTGTASGVTYTVNSTHTKLTIIRIAG